ncbi:MAG: tetratricopeptide repeat protein [Gemmatimonadaceae bacterium]
MADAAFGIDRSIETSSYSPIVGGDRPTPDRMLRSQGDVEVESHPEMVSLLRQGAAKLEAGNDTEAVECLRKALEIGDRTVGADHPDLIILLNDLSRIYLRQSAYAAAEPLLLRLLEMKRSKGEDHPEVATVLASLATVRQGLGRHESAEQLWRRVLEIRERTLAPNHFAIATALEHFGETCSARGKIREALAAFQRALTIRERTLGAEHPSLRASRERIADLQLQGSDGSFDPGASAPAVFSNDRFRLLSGESHSVAAPAPPTLEKSPAPVTRKATAVIQPSFSDSPATETFPNPTFEPSFVDPGKTSSFVDEIAPNGLTTVQPDVAAYRDVLESIRDELENPAGQAQLFERSKAIVASAVALLGKRQVAAGVVVLVVVLLAIGVSTDSRGFGEVAQPTALGAATPDQQVTAAPSAPALVTPASREIANLSIPAAAPLSTAKAIARPQVSEEKSTPKKRTEQASEPKRPAIPQLSSTLMSGLQSAATRAGGAAAKIDDPITIDPSAVSIRSRANFDFSEQTSGPQRARLIGELPTPRLPNELADVEGEVRVRFNVDTQGRPVMSTIVVETSPNPLLTSAVRAVIPGIRFEPARSGGAESKAIGDVVQVGFHFARK